MSIGTLILLFVCLAVPYAILRLPEHSATDIAKEVPTITALVWAFGGGIVGFYIGLLTCVIPAAGNMCGIVGFITGPIGMVAGYLTAARNHRKRHP
jgi:hypothetical protein